VNEPHPIVGGNDVSGDKGMKEQSIVLTDKIRHIQKLVREGGLAEAIGLLEGLLDEHCQGVGARLEIEKLYPLFCRLCIRTGQTHRALKWIERAVEFDDKLEEILRGAVEDLLRKRKPEQALAVAERLSRVRPDNHIHCFLLGGIFTQLRRYEEAEVVFQISMTIRQESADACLGLANCYLAQGKNGQAGKCLRRFMEKGYRSQEVFKGLQHLYRNGTLLPEDAQFLEEQVRLHKARMFLNVGWMNYSQGEKHAAVDNFKKALRIGGKNPQIYLGLKRAVRRCSEEGVPEVYELGELFRNIEEEVRNAH